MLVNRLEDPFQLDITEPEEVDIVIRDDGKVLWVNINGICRLRLCKIKTIKLYDLRSKKNAIPD